jgi:uncharacterized protein (TIGR02246 family)
MTIARIAGFAMLVALTAAAAAGQATPPSKSQAGGADVDAIKAVADAYVKGSLASDAKAIAALYTDDAMEMPPHQPMVKGRSAIEQYYQRQFASGSKVSAFSVTHIQTEAAGDLGYDVGTYQQTMTPAGADKPVSDSGKYVVIMKRAGSAWKVAYAIYNSDQPPQPPSAR